jgi:hypothetical protein
MNAAKEKMTIGDLEPLICDADNMLDVLVNLLDSAGFNSTDEVITDRYRELISFAVNVAVDMSGKVRKAYYEAIEGNAS